MPCPHYEMNIVKRSSLQSAVAAAAYQSGEKLFCDYDQEIKDPTRKDRVIYKEIMLPDNAPREYADRATLWNAVEAEEKNWNSQLARRMKITLPRELSDEDNLRLARQYVQEQFISKGMIADLCVHDREENDNPHFHVLLTMRPMDENGKWLPKSRKEYILDENGQRIKTASGDWKSRKVNTVDWNEHKYGEIWRHEWEVLQNHYLEQAGRPERVDMRSFERQGNPHVPQVHMGSAATAMERKGIQTDLGNLNREIRATNRLFDAIREKIKAIRSWIAELSEQIKALEPTAEPDDINVRQILRDYKDIRHMERLSWKSQKARSEATTKDLKKVLELTAVLDKSGIATLGDFKKFLSAKEAEHTGIRNAIRANSRRINDINALMKADKTIQEMKPMYDKYASIHFKSAKQKFKEEHSEEFDRYYKANRLLRKFNLQSPIDSKALCIELTQLEQADASLSAQASDLKQELDQLGEIRYCIRQVMPDEMPKVIDGKTSVTDQLDSAKRKNELEQLEKTVPQTEKEEKPIEH